VDETKIQKDKKSSSSRLFSSISQSILVLIRLVFFKKKPREVGESLQTSNFILQEGHLHHVEVFVKIIHQVQILLLHPCSSVTEPTRLFCKKEKMRRMKMEERGGKKKKKGISVRVRESKDKEE
jgi:hypothetical protein